MKKIIFAIGVALGLLAVEADVVNPAAFSYRAEIAFPGYGFDSALENFPVLVRLNETEGGFSYTATSKDGSDIRFALKDGTLLNSEVSLWNPEGESHIWVSIPSLSKESTVFMYWGGPGFFPTSQTDGSVWTAAGYFGVWHMDEGSEAATAKDSAGGLLDGTHIGTAPGQEGKVGRSVRISSAGYGDGAVKESKGIKTSAYSDVGNKFVFSLWAKYPDQQVGNDRFASHKSAYNADSGWEISGKRYDSDNVDFRGSSGTSAGDGGNGAKLSMKNMDWSHLFFVFNGNEGTFYKNNSWQSSGALDPVKDNDLVLMIGNEVNGQGVAFKGWMDEVRLYKGVPDRNWISTEYNSVNDPSFAVVGEAEKLSFVEDIPIMGEAAVISVGRHSAEISWNLFRASVDASATVTAYYGFDPEDLSNAITLASGGEIATGVHEDTLNNLPCASELYLKIVATGTDGNAESAVIRFSTTGSPVFANPAGVVDGMSLTISGALLEVGEVPLDVTACFGTDATTLETLRSWSGITDVQSFETVATAPSFGNYVVGFCAAGNCPDCGHTFKVVSPLASVTVFGECRWTGAARDLMWNNPANWSSGTVPGEKDTVIFGVESSLGDQTISLGGAQVVSAIIIECVDAFTIGSNDDMTQGYALSASRIVRTGGASAAIGLVTVNAEFNLNEDTTITVAEESEIDIRRIVGIKNLVIDGGGTVKLVKDGDRTAGETEVRGGVLLITGNRQLGSKLTIGGFGKTAVARSNGAAAGSHPFDKSDNQTVILDKGVFDLETDGVEGHWEKEKVGPIIVSNGGTFLPGKRRIQIAIKNATVLTVAGVVVGGERSTIDLSDSTSFVVPEDADSALIMNSSFSVTTGVRFNVGDIPDAAVDLIVNGRISYGWHPRDAIWKTGAGVLRLTGKNTYGGGGELSKGEGTTRILSGTLLVDNDPTVYGSGTGNSLVNVEAGAVLGGTGRIGGLTEEITHWSGNKGSGKNTRVTAKGTADAQAVIAPGTINDEDGSHISGTLTVGVDELHHPVTFGDYSTFKAGFGSAKGAFDALVVNGAVDISATGTKLELVANCELSEVRGGTYTILSASDGITGEFAEIIKPKSSWRVSKVNVRQVEQEEGEPIEVYDALTVSIPGRGMRVFVR